MQLYVMPGARYKPNNFIKINLSESRGKQRLYEKNAAKSISI